MNERDLLADMYSDSYFPDHLVDKVRRVLVNLARELESNRAAADDDVLALTHAATERINDIGEEFYEEGSEIETAARESIAAGFAAILDRHGFGHIDIEDAIAPRDW